jgi:hypothetical protein
MNGTTISKRWSSFVVTVGLAVSASACGTSTRFLSTWSARDAQPVAANGLRVATVFFNGNESVRRESEDVIAKEVARYGAMAVTSYSIIPDNPNDRAVAKRKLEEAGVDAVLSMRVVARERVLDYSGPGYWAGSPNYGSLWGYWGSGWGGVNDPSFLGSDVVVGVETLLYSLKDEKLLWAGMSETFDADDVRSAVKSIAKKAVKEMDEQSVLTRF